MARPVVAVALAATLSIASALVVQAAARTPVCASDIAPGPGARTPIHHVFYIVKENHAFENYFGDLPGVRGYPPNGSFPTAFGATTVVHPFPLNTTSTPDLPHTYEAGVADLDHGRNDGFVAESAAVGYGVPIDAVGYYTEKQLPAYYAYARSYALGDMFFTGVLGPTWPNRFFDLAASTGNWTDDVAPPGNLANAPNILAQLSARGIPWVYDYSSTPYQVTPYLFASVRTNPCESSRIANVASFPSQVSGPDPPAVTIVDPENDGNYSEHPPGNVTLGEEWTVALVNAIFRSPIADSSVVFLTWDENGGFWDPIPPPVTSPIGDGFRVPLLVLSPYTPAGRIVHEVLDPAAVLRFVDDNWGLPYLNARVASAPSLAPFFNFGMHPRPPLLLPTNVGLAPAGRPASPERVLPAAAETPEAAVSPRWVRKA
jgi:phospholipase C